MRTGHRLVLEIHRDLADDLGLVRHLQYRTIHNFRDPDEQQWMCESAMGPWDSWGVASHRGLGRMSSIMVSRGSGGALGMLNEAEVAPVMAGGVGQT